MLKGKRFLHTFHAFTDHNYRFLWLASAFTYTCRWMQITLLSWLVLESTDSPLLVALVGFFILAPMLILGVFGGLLADRVSRRRLLIAVSSTNLLASIVMTLVLVTGHERFWHAYLMIMVTGAGWALDNPSRRSLVHDILGKAWVVNGMAIDALGFYSSKMIGPALAGGLIILADIAGGYLVVNLFYLLATLLLFSLNLPFTAHVQSPTSQVSTSNNTPTRNKVYSDLRAQRSGMLHSTANNLAQGVLYVRNTPIIWAILVSTVLLNLLLFPYTQMVPVIARDVLDTGPGLMGLLMSADGVGALIGAMIIATASNFKYLGRVFISGALLALLSALLFSFSNWYISSFIILTALGLGISCIHTMQSTIIMLVSNEEMRGRALGVFGLAIGANPIGMITVGTVATFSSPTFAVGLFASIGIAGLILVILLMPDLREKITVARGSMNANDEGLSS